MKLEIWGLYMVIRICILLSLHMTMFLSCAANNKTLKMEKYFLWAIMTREDGKPLLSQSVKLDEIIKRADIDKDYYKVLYVGDSSFIIKSYIDNKLIVKYFVNEKSKIFKYIKYDKNKEISCNIIYQKKALFAKHIITCDDGQKTIKTYQEGTLKKQQFFKKKLYKTIISDNNECKEFDFQNKLVRTYECFSYEETRPIDVFEE